MADPITRLAAITTTIPVLNGQPTRHVPESKHVPMAFAAATVRHMLQKSALAAIFIGTIRAATNRRWPKIAAAIPRPRIPVAAALGSKNKPWPPIASMTPVPRMKPGPTSRIARPAARSVQTAIAPSIPSRPLCRTYRRPEDISTFPRQIFLLLPMSLQPANMRIRISPMTR